MHTRLVVLVASLLVVLAPALTPARATSPCNVIQDPPGDVRFPGDQTAPPHYPRSLDIRSADIASDDKQLTSVIRVEELASLDVGSPGGLSYWFLFTAGGTRFLLNAFRTPHGDYFNVYTISGRPGTSSAGAATTRIIGPADGILDEDASEIRLTAPLSMFAAYQPISAGLALKDLHAESFYQVSAVVGRANHTADVANTTASYRASARSCVRVGY